MYERITRVGQFLFDEKYDVDCLIQLENSLEEGIRHTLKLLNNKLLNLSYVCENSWNKLKEKRKLSFFLNTKNDFIFR